MLEIVQWGTGYFRKKGIESPRLNIELLLCDILKINRIDIYSQYDKPLKERELNILHDLVIRRSKREPLQYITGYTYFYGLKIKVDKSVVIPRPETELLVSEVLKSTENKHEELLILDIGTSSGCIAVALAKEMRNSKIIAVDNSGYGLKTAKENAALNNICNIEFYKINILSEIPEETKFNIIVSNPPYIPLKEYKNLAPEILDYEPQSALTDNQDGLTFYKRFSEIFPEILAPGGIFFLEIGFGQSNKLKRIFSNYMVQIIKDFSDIDRVFIGSKK